MRGTLCKSCSKSQQGFRPSLRLRLTALSDLVQRVCWMSHALITSSTLDIWRSTFHTPVCGRRSFSPARYLSSSTHSHTSKRCLANSSSSVFINHYRALCTKRRRGSKASGFRKQCHDGSTTSVHVMTPLLYSLWRFIGYQLDYRQVSADLPVV